MIRSAIIGFVVAIAFVEVVLALIPGQQPVLAFFLGVVAGVVGPFVGMAWGDG